MSSMTISKIPTFLSVHQVAEALGISPDTVRRWDKMGLIRSIRDDRNHRLFDRDEVSRIARKTSGDDSEGSRFQILRREERSSLSVIDLFSGAGGTALGFENAGLNHELLVELDKDAAATLRSNLPSNQVVGRDVAEIEFTKYRGSIDVVEAGFPCQAFSYAGNKHGFADTRGTLFFEFARCVDEVRPKIAIGENVRGLIRHDRGRTLMTMLNTLDEIGYLVSFKLLKAQYFDVPQKRERLIIFATRKGLELPHLYPRERNYTVSVREALEGVPDSVGQKYSERKRSVLEMVPEGGYWKDLPLDIQKEYMGASFYHTGGRTGMARRLSWSEPSLTIVCSPSQKQTERCHPSETRPLTIRESARIQTFPDSWEFHGSVHSQYKQVGNAVPVNLGFHIASAVRTSLEGKMDSDFERVDPMNLDSQLPMALSSEG